MNNKSLLMLLILYFEGDTLQIYAVYTLCQIRQGWFEYEQVSLNIQAFEYVTSAVNFVAFTSNRRRDKDHGQIVTFKITKSRLIYNNIFDKVVHL